MKTKDLKKMVRMLEGNSGRDNRIFSSLNGEILVTSLHIQTPTCVRMPCNLGVNFTLDLKLFKKAVAEWEKIGSEVAFYTEGDVVMVRVGKASPFSLCMEHENLLAPECVIPTTTGFLLPKDLEHFIQATSDDFARPQLTYVYIAGEHVVSTCGFTMLERKGEEGFPILAIPNFISPKDFDVAYKEKNCLVLQGGNIQLEYYYLDDRFYTNFYENSLLGLIESLKVGMAVIQIESELPSSANRILFDFENSRMDVYPGKDDEFYSLPLAYQAKAAPKKLKLNFQYLKKGVRLVGATFNCCVADKYKPVIFENEIYRFVVAPLHID